MPNHRPLRVLISAGEASGEMYGAALLEAMRRKSPERGIADVECFGLGGQRMREAGCDTVVDARDVAVVGLTEVISNLPKIYREFHRLLSEVDRRRPDVAVLIDFPDWNFRLAKELHRRGIPVVYYVSPQLWAWRKGRLKLVQRYVSKMLVIFPFEQQFYASHGVAAEFVGHPLAEMQHRCSRDELALGYGLDAAKPWIALLPGSRRKELRLNLPGVLGAASKLGTRYEFILPVASTLDAEWVREQIRLAQQPDGPSVTLVSDARDALASSRAAIVASGTATVEAAVIGTPFVMIYRVSAMTYALGKRLVNVPFYGMVNLIAGREIVPEFIQHEFTAERVASELRQLIADGTRREQMIADLAEVRAKLRGGAAGAAAENAASAVFETAASVAVHSSG